MRIVVSGPTASGKSDLSLRLAQDFNGQIVNADSVQIYRHLDIGSAKPSLEERSKVPHHLFDIRNPDENFSAGDYVRCATNILDQIAQEGCTAILTGGTTLYLSALLSGLSDLPPANQQVRALLEEESNDSLHEMLQSVDPESAGRLHPNDRIRVIRALEVFRLTGKKMGEFSSTREPSSSEHTVILVMIPDRQKLYEKINARTSHMILAGIIQETEDIMKSFGSDSYPLKSLGYAQVKEYLEGTIQSREELEQKIAQGTRNYAKRQMTFWRQEPRKRGWLIHPTEDEGSICRGHEPSPEMSRQRTSGSKVFQFRYQQLGEYLVSLSAGERSGTDVVYLDASSCNN